MATSEGIPSSIDIEFLELNDNPYFIVLSACEKSVSICRADGAICVIDKQSAWHLCLSERSVGE